MTTENTIYTTAIGDGMPAALAKLIVAQSKLETNNYKSDFFTDGNNAFGYSYVPGAKWQLYQGGPDADNGVPIARYASVADSVHELTDWIKRRVASGSFPGDLGTIATPDYYASLLKTAGYYTATLESYLSGLSYWVGNLPPLSTGGGIGLIVAVGVIAALLFKK